MDILRGLGTYGSAFDEIGFTTNNLINQLPQYTLFTLFVRFVSEHRSRTNVNFTKKNIDYAYYRYSCSVSSQ